jgi:hypothetical protein
VVALGGALVSRSSVCACGATAAATVNSSHNSYANDNSSHNTSSHTANCCCGSHGSTRRSHDDWGARLSQSRRLSNSKKRNQKSRFKFEENHCKPPEWMKKMNADRSIEPQKFYKRYWILIN